MLYSNVIVKVIVSECINGMLSVAYSKAILSVYSNISSSISWRI